jgi:hypothetical protein
MASAWKYSKQIDDPPAKLPTPFSCAALCNSGGFGNGKVIGTAPACGGHCSDCGGRKCFGVSSGDVTDYGHGCSSGNKVCCCDRSQPPSPPPPPPAPTPPPPTPPPAGSVAIAWSAGCFKKLDRHKGTTYVMQNSTSQAWQEACGVVGEIASHTVSCSLSLGDGPADGQETKLTSHWACTGITCGKKRKVSGPSVSSGCSTGKDPGEVEFACCFA